MVVDGKSISFNFDKQIFSMHIIICEMKGGGVSFYI